MRCWWWTDRYRTPTPTRSPRTRVGRGGSRRGAVRCRCDRSRAAPRCRRSVEALGATVVAERSFPDHHRYRERDLRDLDAAPLWITTEKDALKILPRWAHGADLRVLASGLEVEAGDAFVDWLEGALRAKRG
jgi:Tetraacyldisaccharide-1-P 4'-kinase